MDKISPPYPLISEKLKAGTVIPFLGSGASLQPECGIWEKCVERDRYVKDCYLSDKKCLGFPRIGSPNKCLPRAAELACYLAYLGGFPEKEPPDLTKVAQYYEVVVAGRKALHDALHSIFKQDYAFNALHELLAEMPVPLIVTTNYDDLIEKAFDEIKRPYDIVIQPHDISSTNNLLWLPHGSAKPERVLANKLYIDLKKTTVIYKMHGTVNRQDEDQDQYVITEDDYINFLTRMTQTKVVPHILAPHLEKHPFLFLGYSLNDWNLRVVLNRIEHEYSKLKKFSKVKAVKSWAIQYKPSPLEEQFWEKRGVVVFNMSISDFVNELRKYL